MLLYSEDHFLTGRSIYTRLSEEPSLKNVKLLYWGNSNSDQLIKQFNPAIVISFERSSPQTAGDKIKSGGRRQFIKQTWALTVVIKDVATQNTGLQSVDEGGLIISSMLNSLMGYAPVPQIPSSTLNWEGSASSFFLDSFRLMPFIFSIEFII